MTDVGMTLGTETYSRHSGITPNATRRRKVAMDHHGNGTIYDINGNDSLARRLEILSENCSQKDQFQPSVMEKNVSKCEKNEKDENENGYGSKDMEDSGWEGAFLDQIQSLLERAQVSDTLSKCIDEEMVDTNNQPPAPVHRVRRKSCFTLAPVGPVGHYNSLYRNATNGNKLSGTCKDKLSAQHGTRRRMSCASIENQVHAMSTGRRRSVAHAPLNSTVQPARRMSCTNDNHILNHQRQRRKSSAKPFALTVTKISSVQKRLHRIYRQRRRKDRASVNIDDVKHAISGSNGNTRHNDDTDSSGNASSCNEFVDENSNVCELDVTDSNTEIDHEHDDASVDNAVSDTVIDNSEETPAPRRRCSVQIRAWELSRKLRQKRREKRKGFSESPLI